MSTLLKKLGFGPKTARNLLAIIIVAFGGAIIYGLPYFRYDYYDAYVAAYNLTDTQMGTFGSILGIFGMISYLFGGVVADRFSTRTILTVSLIGTGLGGFIHLLPLSYPQLLALYAFWGISSLFAFWPACMKAVRILSDDDDQGKAYGFFEGGRGIAAALMSLGAVGAFALKQGSDDIAGMRTVIIYYSVITILMGVFSWFSVKEDIKEESERVTFKGIGKLLKNPAIWIISMVTFFNYGYTQFQYYFTPYSTEILGMSVTLGALIASSKRWLSLLGNVGGGFWTDKVGTGNSLLISFVVMAAATVGIMVLPPAATSGVPFVILFLLSYVFYNVNYAMSWAMMEKGGIPSEYSATAAGIISTVGYLPEIFCPTMAGTMLENNSGTAGYMQIFTVLTVMLVLGAITVLIWKAYLKKQENK